MSTSRSHLIEPGSAARRARRQAMPLNELG